MQPKAKAVTARVPVIALDHARAHACLSVEHLVATLAKEPAAIPVTMVVKDLATDVKQLKDKMGNNLFSHLVYFCFENHKNHNIHCH